MKEWLTPTELAELGLLDFPQSRSAVVRVIEAEGWNEHPAYVQARSGRGGGNEYHVNLLPALALVEYRQRTITIDAPVQDQAINDGMPEPLVEKSRTAQIEHDARRAVVHAFDRYSDGRGRFSLATNMKIYCDNYNVGSIRIDATITDTLPTITTRSLRRWRDAVAKGDGQTIGYDNSKSRRGTSMLDRANGGDVATHILALIAQNAHYSGEHVRSLCLAEFGETISLVRSSVETQVPMPSVRVFQGFIKALKISQKVALTKLQNPDKYRSLMRASGVGSLRHINLPNQLWQIDASPIDAMCIDGRHTIYACIDIATRRAYFMVSRTPRAVAVALLIRNCILEWGLPEKIKTDNGSDFVAKDIKRLLAALGIELELSDAYTPQQKGHVERVIKTFQHDCAVLLPGFIGHSVADRTAIENRKSFAKRRSETEAETFGVELSGAEFQVAISEWANTIYMHRAHGGLNKKTPFEVAVASTAVKRTVNERALDVLLAPVAGTDGQRTVTKFGIAIDNFKYMVSLLPGTRVFVRQDEHDAGRAYVFEQDGATFIGEAICAELRGIHPSTLVKATREAQTEIIDRSTREARAAMRRIAKGPNALRRILDVAARDVKNVVALPKREASHSTPEIAAALDATSVRDGSITQSTMSDEHQRMHDQLLLEEAQAETDHAGIIPAVPINDGSNITALRTPGNMHQRFKRALELEARLSQQEEISNKDELWLGGYRSGPEYKSLRREYDDNAGQISL